MLFVRLFINKGFSSQDVPVVLQCLEEMLKKRRKQVGKLHRLEIWKSLEDINNCMTHQAHHYRNFCALSWPLIWLAESSHNVSLSTVYGVSGFLGKCFLATNCSASYIDWKGWWKNNFLLQLIYSVVLPFFTTSYEMAHYTFLGNCPPTPPLSQHFAPSEK